MITFDKLKTNEVQTLKISKQIVLDLNSNQLTTFVGPQDQHLSAIQKRYHVDYFLRSNVLEIEGEKSEVMEAIKKIEKMIKSIRNNESLTSKDVLEILHHPTTAIKKHVPITYTFGGKHIYPKTNGQEELVRAMKKHDMVFSVGPAGTGKTFLAVAYAVSLLRDNKIKRIILTRPAVEAGENLGFLPGDLKEKVDPYLQPLYDALNILLGVESVEKMLEKKTIEIAPLAYMRGRTLDDAFIILDEAQNTTDAQMKMFLSRMGYNSKMIINGDITQIDLPFNQQSGLLIALDLLSDMEEIAIVKLQFSDIVRHPLVSKILKRYEKRRKQ